jgi:hypothetical protein
VLRQNADANVSGQLGNREGEACGLTTAIPSDSCRCD